MKAITANRLIDGEVVFWKAGAWIDRFGDAELFDETREPRSRPPSPSGKAQPNVVVDVYPIDLTESEGWPGPRQLPRTHPGPRPHQRTHPRQAGRRRRGDRGLAPRRPARPARPAAST
jgi:hypothetical protein